jgi:hypothetical protein
VRIEVASKSATTSATPESERERNRNLSGSKPPSVRVYAAKVSASMAIPTRVRVALEGITRDCAAARPFDATLPETTCGGKPEDSTAVWLSDSFDDCSV